MSRKEIANEATEDATARLTGNTAKDVRMTNALNYHITITIPRSCVCMYACIYVCMYLCIHGKVIYTIPCIFFCMYVCMYVCLYTWYYLDCFLYRCLQPSLCGRKRSRCLPECTGRRVSLRQAMRKGQPARPAGTMVVWAKG